ncbi:hypothetical protein [Rhodobium gokarnense]|uniref:Uncharacterized protein n=1 Tax=Rhodobium gokarnense TaxID=364296 RepID=A0ABT3HH49_9HYPH|nr:hypothetical protein [Rhodobium gokarnense]MCW2309730.1 hypothetical protein [Rhodobium gokarnense]
MSGMNIVIRALYDFSYPGCSVEDFRQGRSYIVSKKDASFLDGKGIVCILKNAKPKPTEIDWTNSRLATDAAGRISLKTPSFSSPCMSRINAVPAIMDWLAVEHGISPEDSRDPLMALYLLTLVGDV